MLRFCIAEFIAATMYIGFYTEFNPDSVPKFGQAVSHIIEWSLADSRRRRAELLFAREKHDRKYDKM
jgi:hypothetical protein